MSDSLTPFQQGLEQFQHIQREWSGSNGGQSWPGSSQQNISYGGSTGTPQFVQSPPSTISPSTTATSSAPSSSGAMSPSAAAWKRQLMNNIKKKQPPPGSTGAAVKTVSTPASGLHTTMSLDTGNPGEYQQQSMTPGGEPPGQASQNLQPWIS